MEKTTKKNLGTAAVLGMILTAGLGYYAFTQDLSQSDATALDKIGTAYKEAMNSVGNGQTAAIDKFMADYAAPGDFQATLHTGQVVTNGAEFKTYLATMKDLLEIGGAAPNGKYEFRDIKTQVRIPVGDTIFSAGTTTEWVQAATTDKATGKKILGAPLEYGTLWGAVLKKDKAGAWKLHRANVKVVSGIDAAKLAALRALAAASLPKLKQADN